MTSTDTELVPTSTNLDFKQDLDIKEDTIQSVESKSPVVYIPNDKTIDFKQFDDDLKKTKRNAVLCTLYYVILWTLLLYSVIISTYVLLNCECINGNNNGDMNSAFGVESSQPTVVPTSTPYLYTNNPSINPTDNPSSIPSDNPSINPTGIPSKLPTNNPTNNPSKIPSDNPSINPTEIPSKSPSNNPTETPTKSPSSIPTTYPSTGVPSSSPTPHPTYHCLFLRFDVLNSNLSPLNDDLSTIINQIENTYFQQESGITVNGRLYWLNNIDDSAVYHIISPTNQWIIEFKETTIYPMMFITNSTLYQPEDYTLKWIDNIYNKQWILQPECYSNTLNPTNYPTANPTKQPSNHPSNIPTNNPTSDPTFSPSKNPTLNPTIFPTKIPTKDPSKSPTLNPSSIPTNIPTINPTLNPTTSIPTILPTTDPSNSPTSNPSSTPTTANPSENPSENPSASPTFLPTGVPSYLPTSHPTIDCSFIRYDVTNSHLSPFNPDRLIIINQIENTLFQEQIDAKINHRSYWLNNIADSAIYHRILPIDQWIIQFNSNATYPMMFIANSTLYQPEDDGLIWIDNIYDTEWMLQPQCDSNTLNPTINPTLEPTTHQPTTKQPTIEPTVNPTTDPTLQPTIIKYIYNIGDFKLSFLSSNHDNWLLCDGSYYDPITYPDLFGAIGYTYGQSATLFRVPFMDDQTIGIAGGSHPIASSNGSETITLSENQVPEHWHYITTRWDDTHSGSADIALSMRKQGSGDIDYILYGHPTGIPSNYRTGLGSGSGDSINIMQPTSFVTNMFISYRNI